MKSKKSLFVSPSIRPLSSHELGHLTQVLSILNLETDRSVISYIPKFFSKDNVSRPLVLRKETVIKIESKHGKINPHNLLINANDWDIAIKNIDSVPEKICLIKQIPDSNNILLIGAFKENGFFVLSHYEVEVLQSNQLKSLLGRGDVFRKDA